MNTFGEFFQSPRKAAPMKIIIGMAVKWVHKLIGRELVLQQVLIRKTLHAMLAVTFNPVIEGIES